MHVQSSGTPCDASMGLWGHTQCSIAADTVASTTVVARYWNHADDDADEGNQARGSLIALPAILVNAPDASAFHIGPKSHRQSPTERSRIAQKVIQKYQQATCEQLWRERAQKGKKPA